MIKLRPRREVPATLSSVAVVNTKSVIEQEVNRNYRATSDLFDAHWLKDDVRKVLWEHHDRKCCYCERIRELKYESDVEHFRPKAAVEEDNTHPGYWWLAYEWTNYLYACKPCNEAHKKNHFPLTSNSKRATSPADALSDEQPYILNPVDDDPETAVGFDWQEAYGIYVKAIGLDLEGRGAETIRLMKLNRQELMEERAEIIELLQNVADLLKYARHFSNTAELPKCIEQVQTLTNSNQSFAGFKRAYFRAAGLGEYVNDGRTTGH